MGVARRRKGVCETCKMGNRDWDGGRSQRSDRLSERGKSRRTSVTQLALVCERRYDLLFLAAGAR